MLVKCITVMSATIKFNLSLKLFNADLANQEISFKIRLVNFEI